MCVQGCVWGETNTHAGTLGGFGRPHPQSSDLSCLPHFLAPVSRERGARTTSCCHGHVSRPGRGRCAAVKKETPKKSERFRGYLGSQARRGLAGLRGARRAGFGGVGAGIQGAPRTSGHRAPRPGGPRAAPGSGPEPSASRGRPHAGPQRTMALFPSGSQLVGGRVLWAWRGGGSGRARGGGGQGASCPGSMAVFKMSFCTVQVYGKKTVNAEKSRSKLCIPYKSSLMKKAETHKVRSR